MRGIVSNLRAACLLIALLLCSGAAFAQYPDDDVEAEEPGPDAGQLFDQGLQDMLAGKYETGCPALKQSYELEPLAGALFTLAECEAKWGKLGTAARHYRQYLSKFQSMTPEQQEKQRGRDQIARDQIDVLKGAAPQVQIVVPADAPEGTIIKLDGEQLDPVELASPVMVDPGAHQVTIEVPGGAAPNAYDFEVTESERTAVRLELPEGAAVDDGGDGASIDFGLREGSYIVGGVGAVFLIVGIIAGGITMGKKGTIEDNCDGNACNAEGLDAADSASTTGAVSTVGFIVGPVLLGAAVVMFLLGGDDEAEPSDEPPSDDVALSLRPAVMSAPGAMDSVLLGVSGTW
ncbi:MAG: hypothetical protein JRI23_05320 [Deltaproteobacteria bacterium]|jgi:hypothetical protein|nr:hypothetical protein [Deltaproteobacteria bacterium]MBW2530972.1 hypothetical protein [Deltaproteobacteria bacterium]